MNKNHISVFTKTFLWLCYLAETTLLADPFETGPQFVSQQFIGDHVFAREKKMSVEHFSQLETDRQ